MTNILEKWNKKWKAHQLTFLMADIPEVAKEFFKHIEFIDAKTNWIEEDTDLEYVIVCKDTRTNFVHDIARFNHGENIFARLQLRNEKGEVIEISYENWDYIFETYDGSDEDINEAFGTFDFDTFVKEYTEEQIDFQIQKSTEELQNVAFQGIEFNSKTGEYLLVLTNGLKIPYKKEEKVTYDYHPF